MNWKRILKIEIHPSTQCIHIVEKREIDDCGDTDIIEGDEVIIDLALMKMYIPEVMPKGWWRCSHCKEMIPPKVVHACEPFLKHEKARQRTLKRAKERFKGHECPECGQIDFTKPMRFKLDKKTGEATPIPSEET